MKKIKQAFFVFITVICLCGCSQGVKYESVVIDENSQNICQYGENMIVSRALAAKMVWSIFFQGEKCSKNNFFDASENMWYYQYANVMFEKNIMVGSNGYFMPLEPITYMEAMKVIKRLGGKDVDYDAKNGDEAVSYALWLSMLIDTLEKRGEEIQYTDISIFATGDSEDISPMTSVTDKGVYKCCGIWLDGVIDKTISSYIVDDEIMFIKDIISQEAEFKGVNITNNNDFVEAELFSAKRKLKSNLTDIKNGSADITVKNSEIVKID